VSRTIGATNQTTRANALGLTPRQMEIARLTVRGYRGYEIATELGISAGTVKVVMSAVYNKLDITCAATLGYLLGLLDAGGPDVARAACPERTSTGGR